LMRLTSHLIFPKATDRQNKPASRQTRVFRIYGALVNSSSVAIDFVLMLEWRNKQIHSDLTSRYVTSRERDFSLRGGINPDLG
jgi:hypothetical protein